MKYIFVLIGLFLNFSLIFSQPFNKALKDFELKKYSSPLIINGKEIEANSISAWIYNDGEFFSNRSSLGPGFEWPKGSGLNVIFSAGLWLGAKVRDSIRVATAGHFVSEYKPGLIINGNADDFMKPEYRTYLVRPKYDTPGSNPDFAEWPVDQGAPYHDVDKNGVYNPFLDKPALIWGSKIFYPDVLMYSVFNDADQKYHKLTWGSTKPMGAEVRQTTWAFGNIDNLNKVIFMRFEIINKSNNSWDSTFIAFWADPDLGNAFDDMVGVDTNSNVSYGSAMAFCYNFDNNDDSMYGTPPPSVGIKLLQGPRVPTGDPYTYAFWSGNMLFGYKNIQPSSFSYFCNVGSDGCSEDLGDPRNFIETYNVLKGLKRNGLPYIGYDGMPTKFPLIWPPLPSWSSAPIYPIRDARIAYKIGPFTMAPNDTQQVIYAIFVGQGVNNISSVEIVRNYSRFLSFVNPLGFDINLGPLLKEFSINYETPDVTNVKIQVDEKRASSIVAKIYKLLGLSYPYYGDSLVATISLFDDGLHWDEGPSDGIFGNKFNIAPVRYGYYIDLDVLYLNGSQSSFNRVKWFSSFGPMEIPYVKYVTDNVNQNGKLNPGENARFTLAVKNESKFYLDGLKVIVHPIYNEYIRSAGKIIPIDLSLCPSCIYEKPYDSTNDSTYFSLDVNPNTPDGYEFNLYVQVAMTDLWLEDAWKDTIKLKVEKNTFQPRIMYPHHEEGFAEGNFGILLVDSTALRDNFYRITIERPESGGTFFNLINLNTSQTLLAHFPLPDTFGYLIPVTEGFRITRGNITTNRGVHKGEYIPIENKWFGNVTPSRNPDILEFGVYYPRESNLFSMKSNIDIEDLKTVVIRFNSNITQRAYRYLSGFSVFPPTPIKDSSFIPYVLAKAPGFVYQDYELYPLNNPNLGRTVPFTVWEVNNRTGAERQLNIAIVEHNDSLWGKDGSYLGKGKIDGKWFPTVHRTGGSELLYIFSSSYNETPDTFYTKRNLYYSMYEFDICYVIWVRLLDKNSCFKNGDVLRITPYFPLKNNDVFTFNPLRLLNVNESGKLPTEFKLYQNYPNPFNSLTIINYDLPFDGKVELKIYDILGKCVATLINEYQNAGCYSKQWFGKSDKGLTVASGIYFYKLTLSNSKIHFTHTKKMLLIK